MPPEHARRRVLRSLPLASNRNLHSGYRRPRTHLQSLRQAGMRPSYSFCSRFQSSQSGAGCSPVARATSTSRCMCHPAPTFRRLARSGRRRWIPVSSTLLPLGSSSKLTLPLPCQMMAGPRGGSNSRIRLYIPYWRHVVPPGPLRRRGISKFNCVYATNGRCNRPTSVTTRTDSPAPRHLDIRKTRLPCRPSFSRRALREMLPKPRFVVR